LRVADCCESEGFRDLSDRGLREQRPAVPSKNIVSASRRNQHARRVCSPENSQIPSEKHAEYCRAEYEPEYNHTNQNVAHPALPRSDTPSFR
jgi:hypothetical protein